MQKHGQRKKREDVYKKESGQIHNSITWFEKNYPDADVHPRIIINAKREGHQTHLDENVRVMNRNKMELFKTKYYGFFSELSAYTILQLTDKVLNNLLTAYNLTSRDIINLYFVDIK